MELTASRPLRILHFAPSALSLYTCISHNMHVHSDVFFWRERDSLSPRFALHSWWLRSLHAKLCHPMYEVFLIYFRQGFLIKSSWCFFQFLKSVAKWFPKAIDEYQFDRRNVSNENTKANFLIPLCSLAVAFRIFIWNFEITGLAFLAPTAPLPIWSKTTNAPSTRSRPRQWWKISKSRCPPSQCPVQIWIVQYQKAFDINFVRVNVHQLLFNRNLIFCYNKTAIENLWIYIRKFMNKTQPPYLEKRYQVVKRLARAVRHVNTVHCKTVENVCNSLRQRCRDVIKAKGGYINY